MGSLLLLVRPAHARMRAGELEPETADGDLGFFALSHLELILFEV
jgi:hypothetical protein